jgi:membrane-associated protein
MYSRFSYGIFALQFTHMSAITDFLHYLDPANLIELIKDEVGLAWVWPVLALIIFAETGLMVGFFLPGDSLLFFTGLLVASPDPSIQLNENIWLMLVVLILAAIAGDQVGYLTGRKIGGALYKRKDTWYFKRKYIEKTEAFYNRHGGKTIILGRFVPIVRTFAPIVAGVVKLEYRKFVPYNVIGGIAWISSMLLAGYFLGEFIDRKYIKYVTIGIILVSVLPILYTAFVEWKRSKRIKAFSK